MSTELIIVLGVLGVGGLVALFYVSHSLEKQKREKALLIANLGDYIIRLQRLLDAIPAPYLGKDIQLLLLEQIKKRVERLVELAPGNEKYRKKRDSVNGQLAEVSATTPQTQAPAFKSPEQANEVRKLLQDLSKVIESFMQNRVIDQNEARKYLTTIQSGFFDANLGYMTQVAETSKSQGKPKMAILNYEKVIAEMQKRNQKGAYNDKIARIKEIINELKAASGSPTAQEQSASAAGELNQGMDEFLEEEDAWKKKYF